MEQFPILDAETTEANMSAASNTVTFVSAGPAVILFGLAPRDAAQIMHPQLQEARS